MSYHWNWWIFFEPSLDGTHTWLETMFWGLGWTIATSVAAFAIALVLGSLVGVARHAPVGWMRAAGTVFVELFRNVPLLVQMFLWYFVLPELLPRDAGMALKHLPNASFYTAVICLGCYHAARMAEVVRAGLETLSSGQRMAGQALGLTLPQTYRYVLLPMAFRIVVPAITSEFLSCTKNSSVALAIGLIELTGSARAMQENSFQVFEAFTAATVLYLMLNLATVFTMRSVERLALVPGYGGKTPKIKAL
ncbi:MULTISPECIES: amino acid ABC transporter permease [Rhodopseudomonas]|uniref:Glutamate ABC transporter permease n=1 Tax=Rhodopseudomonas palustris TaxID=1076 RepID=A0A0D7EMT3_RHOPL|nr:MULTISPECIES: amino acid ABC transporter permease [Rhodopseudomonas]KIZ41971.1 glutamate ABC transporter permease [Rhodopseudomonas palustris]MDF3810328.1 amino acid ABC transporter permease [Rhodopseudomonas sp. BAL398]WOK16595.1 amino acid ABC transporter permease [Rhodopseudomonas sp. BAL398]